MDGALKEELTYNNDVLMKLLILLAIIVSGCATPRTYWQYEAEAIYHHLPMGTGCKKRVAYLSNEIKEPHYVVHGWYRDKPHRWIEKDGVILEPSRLNYSKRHYEVGRKELVE